jgi:raffinose/stachyose/melibiose transport system substrate-binding protein
MKSNMLKKVLGITLALSMTASLAACGGQKTDTQAASGSTAPAAETTAPAADTKAAEPVTLKFFSNLPDRTAGQGKVEQQLIDSYLQENSNVKIELETLQDEPYKQKFKAYTASASLPDVLNVWGQPAFLGPVMTSGYIAELNKADYDSYGFFPGSLDGFSQDGKLYGLPRNTDVMVLYYNKDIFDKNGLKAPTTLKELEDVSKALRAKGIAPCAINGKDKWALSILYHDLAIKESGNPQIIRDALAGKTSFTKEESLVKAAKDFKELMDTKFFQDSFTAADYGAARNLFGQGKAAMYYMGSWEMGMVSDENLPEAVRKTMVLTSTVAVDGGKGKISDIMAWNGGGYAAAANSKVKGEAIKFLNYIFKPDNWAKNVWQQGVCAPAQKYDSYMTGNETQFQKDFTALLGGSTLISGVTVNDSHTPSFKTDSENLCQQLAAGTITPEKFLEEMDKAADKK